MKDITAYFNQAQLDLFKDIGIILQNNRNYTDKELIEIHDIVTDRYMDEGFDEKGEPTEKAAVYESIIDLFYDKFDI